MVTLKIIAEKAGVSKATVSNVINGNLHKVSDTKAAAIRTLIDEHGYVPNRSARSLSNKSSRIILLIVPHSYRGNALSDPYNAQFTGELLRLLQENDYICVIRTSSDVMDIVKNLNEWNAEGVMFFGTFDKDIRGIQERADIPFVFTDSYSSVRRINNVGIDDFRGGMLAAEHLLAYGHRKTVFFAPGLHSSEVDNQRMQGFVYALSKAGVTLPDANYLLADSYDGGTMADSLLALPERPTAAFVTADIAAITLMDALKRRGLRLPEDMSIIGFDDSPLARYVTPRLTTIRQDVEQKARCAVDIMMRHLKTPSLPMESMILDVSLVPRDSVSPPKDSRPIAG